MANKTSSFKVQPIELNKELIKELLLKQLESTEFLNTNDITLKLKVTDIGPPMPTEMPKIQIHPDALLKIQTLVAKCNTEIAWHGLVFKEQPNNYIIYDILVYPQKVRATTVESDDDSYPMWIMNQSDANIEHLRMQGHSHVNMGVSASGTDEGYYKDLLQHVNDYYITMIVNKKGDVNLRLYDIVNNLLYSDLMWEVVNTNYTYDDWYTKMEKEYITPHVCVKPSTTYYADKYRMLSNTPTTTTVEDNLFFDDEDAKAEEYFRRLDQLDEEFYAAEEIYYTVDKPGGALTPVGKKTDTKKKKKSKQERWM